MSFPQITKRASQLFDSDKNTWIAEHCRGARKRAAASARDDGGEI
jgi:hypothetical protein